MKKSKQREEKCSSTKSEKVIQHIISREERIAKIRQFTLMSDVFLSVALQDPAACQHVLRVLTGIDTLVVKEVRTQYTLSKLQSRSARLDVFAEDGAGKLYVIEIQRRDTVDHPRRVRLYGAMVDSEFLEKGAGYEELPERYVIYISETDIWGKGKTIYPVYKTLGKEGMPYDDGEHIIYVNAQINDGSRIADLMRYFRTAAPDDESEGDLSKRVRFLKEEGGENIMCEVTEWIEQKGKEEKAKEVAGNLAQMGMSTEKIAQALDESVQVVRKWLGETGAVKQEL